MAIAFARSLRSLQADGWRAPMLGLLAGILLMVAWASWFFLSSVAFTESGRLLANDANGFLIVQFPTSSLDRLKRGQAATLRWSGDAVSKASLRAVIAQVRPTDLAAGQVRIAIPPDQPAPPPGLLPTQDNESELPAVTVEVTVERLSPAQLVLRRIGMSTSGNDA